MCNECVQDKEAQKRAEDSPTPRLDRVYNEMQAKTVGGGAVGTQTKSSIAYTPFFIRTMLSLYTSPQERESILSMGVDAPAPMRETLNLLERAGIVQTVLVRIENNNTVTSRRVDEEALRTYVNALCNVPIPEKVWQMRPYLHRLGDSERFRGK